MLQNIFKQHLKKVDQKLSKRQINNLQRANKSLLIRIAKCFDTLIKYNAGVDYYVPIYGDQFNIDNKIRKKTLDILKQENIIEVKTNKDGKESWQSKFNGSKVRLDINHPTPKSYCFTEYGWSLIQNQQLVNEIKQLVPTKESKYNSPENITNKMLKKAAKDNLSLEFKLDKPLPFVVKEYLEANKTDWYISDKNYHTKYLEAQRIILNTIKNSNNKLLKVKERMYSALSLCPKELRKYFITPEGKHIEEAFDINSSIFTLLGPTLQLYMKQNNIPIPAKFYEEMKWLIEKCFDPNMHIYNFIGRTKYSKQQIKPHTMQVVFSNNEDIQKMDKNNGPRNHIKEFIKSCLPTMWSLLISFPQQINDNYEVEMNQYNQFIEQITLYNAGISNTKPKYINHPKQIKSSIWRYFQQTETHYMLQLKNTIESNINSTCYWIHDCLCLESSMINQSLIVSIHQWFFELINNESMMLSIAINSNENQSSIIWGRHDDEYNILTNEIKNLIKYKKQRGE